MGVGQRGIAFVDLIEAPYRAQLARYRLRYKRAKAQNRQRLVNMMINAIYLVIVVVLM